MPQRKPQRIAKAKSRRGSSSHPAAAAASSGPAGPDEGLASRQVSAQSAAESGGAAPSSAAAGPASAPQEAHATAASSSLPAAGDSLAGASGAEVGLGDGAHGKNLLLITARIQTAVTTLFKTKKQEDRQKAAAAAVAGGAAQRTPSASPDAASLPEGDGGAAAAASGGAAGAAAAGAEAGARRRPRPDSSELAGGSDGSDHDADARASGSDVYDFEEAADHVRFLLEEMKAEERVNIMGELNDWYAGRLDGVDDAKALLCQVEDDYMAREEEMKESMTAMLGAFEEKQVREVRILVQTNNTLRNGAAGKYVKKRRRRFARRALQQQQELPFASFAALPARAARQEKAEETTSEDGAEGSEKGEEGSAPADQSSEKGAAIATKKRQSRVSFGGGLRASTAIQDEEEASSSKEDSASASDEMEVNTPEEAEVETKAPELTPEDALDVEAARKILKEMYEAPQRALGGETIIAREVLQHLAVAQDGQAELQKRVELGKQHCELLRAAVDHLAAGSASSASPAVRELIDRVRLQIFGRPGSSEGAIGPDPEELEEECNALERLLSHQKKDVEDISRLRGRARYFTISDAGDADADADAAKEDDDDAAEEEPEVEVQLKRSNVVHARDMHSKPGQGRRNTLRDSLQHIGVPSFSLGRSPNSAAPTKPDGAAAKAEAKPVSSGPPQASDAGRGRPPKGSNDPGDVGSTAADKIQMLRQLLQEKEEHAKQVQDLQTAMEREQRILFYCMDKAQAGIDSIIEEFDPERYADGHPAVGKKEKEEAKDPSPVAKPKKAAAPKGGAGKRRHKSIVAQKVDHAPNQVPLQLVDVAEHENLSEVLLAQDESNVREKIGKLQGLIARETARFNTEQSRHKTLKKEVKELQSKYKQMIRGDRNVPKTLEELQEQVNQYEDMEKKLRSKIAELAEDLDVQSRQYQKAQQDIMDRERRMLRLPPPSAEPPPVIEDDRTPQRGARGSVMGVRRSVLGDLGSGRGARGSVLGASAKSSPGSPPWGGQGGASQKRGSRKRDSQGSSATAAVPSNRGSFADERRRQATIKFAAEVVTKEYKAAQVEKDEDEQASEAVVAEPRLSPPHHEDEPLAPLAESDDEDQEEGKRASAVRFSAIVEADEAEADEEEDGPRTSGVRFSASVEIDESEDSGSALSDEAPDSEGEIQSMPQQPQPQQQQQQQQQAEQQEAEHDDSDDDDSPRSSGSSEGRSERASVSEAPQAAAPPVRPSLSLPVPSVSQQAEEPEYASEEQSAVEQASPPKSPSPPAGAGQTTDGHEEAPEPAQRPAQEGSKKAARPQVGRLASSGAERAPGVGSQALHRHERKSIAAEDPAALAQNELTVLLQLQSSNEGTKQEIDDIIDKMARLRKFAKRGGRNHVDMETIRRIIGIPENVQENKPPPEYFALKREVRHRQNEVRNMRKKWWTDHKELDVILHKLQKQGVPVPPPEAPAKASDSRSAVRHTLTASTSAGRRMEQGSAGGSARPVPAAPPSETDSRSSASVGESRQSRASFMAQSFIGSSLSAVFGGDQGDVDAAMAANNPGARFSMVRQSLARNENDDDDSD